MAFTPEQEAELLALLAITDKTISQLEASPALTDSMLAPVENSTGTFAASMSKFKDYFLSQKATKSVLGVSYLSNPITIANNATDANNDIDFSPGTFQFSDGSGQALATAIMTKRLDATWSQGTGNGGLLNGTAVPKAINSTYHCYKIYNPTTGAEDSAFLLGIAGTAPDPTSVLPSGYTKFNRVGSILTDASGNIRAFIQNEKLFSLITPLISQNVNILTNSRLPYSIDVPVGIKTLANIYGSVNKNVSGSSQTYISDLATTDINPTTLSGFYTMVCNIAYNSNAEIWRSTNESAQIGIRCNNNGGANSTQILIMTLGWYDNLLKY
jgi:hypothetical protein